MTDRHSFTRFSFNYPAEAAALLPQRPKRSSKSTFGRVLCVCGCASMSGAAYLAAKAAYRTGAGLVEIFTHESNRAILGALLPEAIITVYSQYDRDALADALGRADGIVVGCGLGISDCSRAMLSYILRSVDTEKAPLIIDADGLNIIARNPSLFKYTRGAVLTPHPLEMSRLTGDSVEDILADPESSAHRLASGTGAICVLKDHNTVVSDGGERIYVNSTGNSGMATGGSGDVLAGIIAGIAVQKRHGPNSPLNDAALSVYLHGLCGDIAAAELGEYSLMASDLIDCLPKAIKRIIS